ncbi:MAG: HAD-IIB family hydrolase [Minisyncoccia bacterium]
MIFDLDGTLAPSKSPMEPDMTRLLAKLLEKTGVVVISGGSWSQFEKQFLASANFSSGQLERLFLAPTSGASFFRFANGKWHRVYAEVLSREEKKRIFEAFDYALPKGGYVPPKNPHGELIEDRVTQVSFSALGQQAPLALKEKWDPDKKRRLKIVPFLKEKLPDLEVRIGGTTTIDITKKGIDKAYGIQKISEELGLSIDRMLFVGDALFEGGNDEAAKKTGIDCRAVRDTADTKQLIRELIGQ